MSTLRALHLEKRYKKRKVVKDVSLYINQGEIVGLLGPNGAGKTTSFYPPLVIANPRFAWVKQSSVFKDMDCFVARGAPRNDDVTHIWTSSIYDEPIPQKNSHFQVRALR
jgi:Fe-S cluster assembly ATPase SufC